MGLREQSATVASRSFFFIFRGAGACGVAKAIHKQFYFSLLAHINIITIIKIIMKIYISFNSTYNTNCNCFYKT